MFDGASKDRYQAGNFIQGGAYSFSFALMLDGGGDDTYRSGTGADTQGNNGDASEYGEPSLGVFVDAKAKSIEEAIEKP